jgi:predicted ATPase
LPTLAFALEGAALFHQFRREIEAAQQQARAILLLASEQGFTYFAAVGQLLQGWAQRDADAHEASIKQMHQGLAAHRATEIEIFHPYFLGLLADVYGRAQQTTAGLTLLIETLALVDKTGQRFYEAEWYRLKGELLLQQTSDNPTEAESCFQPRAWRSSGNVKANEKKQSGYLVTYMVGSRKGSIQLIPWTPKRCSMP